jgi:hypothetical protein
MGSKDWQIKKCRIWWGSTQRDAKSFADPKRYRAGNRSVAGLPLFREAGGLRGLRADSDVHRQQLASRQQRVAEPAGRRSGMVAHAAPRRSAVEPERVAASFINTPHKAPRQRSHFSDLPTLMTLPSVTIKCARKLSVPTRCAGVFGAAAAGTLPHATPGKTPGRAQREGPGDTQL